MLKQEIIKIVVFLLINIIIYGILCFYIVKLHTDKSNISNEFSEWNTYMPITDEQKEIFLKDIDIYETKNNNIELGENVNIYIGKDKKDKKAIGVFIINAKYDKIENLEMQFEKFKVKINMESYMRPVYIINEPNYSVSINNINQNECDIIFVTNLPYTYKKQDNDENYNAKIKYFIKENERISLSESKSKINKEMIIKHLIIFDVIFLFIYYTVRFINQNH
ncbi:MAG: hypothetical protein IKD77_01540 [Bacilli bacterium]|nr:hypothetical protein [Bacilli bacterium]